MWKVQAQFSSIKGQSKGCEVPESLKALKLQGSAFIWGTGAEFVTARPCLRYVEKGSV